MPRASTDSGRTGALTIAITGAGLMGSWHARYARACGGSVCGVADRDGHAASHLASRYAGAGAFQDVTQLLEQCRPGVVHICTPVASHVEIAEAALEAGAHVLIEKPLAESAAACRRLLESAGSKGLLLQPVHQFPFQHGFRAAQAVLPRLGRILFLEATFCSAGGERPGSKGDDIAAEILPHPLSLAERLVPGLVQRADWHVRRLREGEWRISGSAQDISISVLISLHARPTEASLRIGTEGGMVELDLFHGFATIDTAAVSRKAKIARPFRRSAIQFAAAGRNLARRFVTREFAYPGLRTLISEFYAAVRGAGPPPITAEEILAVAAARDSVVQALALQQERGGR